MWSRGDSFCGGIATDKIMKDRERSAVELWEIVWSGCEVHWSEVDWTQIGISIFHNVFAAEKFCFSPLYDLVSWVSGYRVMRSQISHQFERPGEELDCCQSKPDYDKPAGVGLTGWAVKKRINHDKDRNRLVEDQIHGWAKSSKFRHSQYNAAYSTAGHFFRGKRSLVRRWPILWVRSCMKRSDITKYCLMISGLFLSDLWFGV